MRRYPTLASRAVQAIQQALLTRAAKRPRVRISFISTTHWLASSTTLMSKAAGYRPVFIVGGENRCVLAPVR